ncbi:hypothetical protein EV715DRAFT_295606 [Schizophyllum commune]
MSIPHSTHGVCVDDLLERAASVANLAMLRTYVEPAHIQIAAIEVYTPLLESKLVSLHPNDPSNRKRVLAQLDIHRSILAPIRRLPVELLSEIFFQAAYESPLQTLQVAVTIARVCSIWRRVAHSRRGLWTRVVVRSLRDFQKYVELFLPLAKDDLLDLRCDNHRILRSLWEFIEVYASQWRFISFEGRLRTLPDLKVLFMENLERLVVDAYDAPASSELSALDFIIAPDLRRIALTLDELQDARQLHVPVTRALTSLEITTESPFPVTHTLPLLKACANTLQSLTIRIRHPLDGPEGSYSTTASDTFVMGALTYLRLVDPACALINHITAPLIEELILSNVPEYGTRSLYGFLTRGQASHHLEVLRVYQPDERDVAAWRPCIQLMNNLKDLHFDDLLSNVEFLKQMTRHEDQAPILPALQNVAICRVFWAHEELHDIIGDMCASRSKEVVIGGETAYELLGWIKD